MRFTQLCTWFAISTPALFDGRASAWPTWGGKRHAPVCIVGAGPAGLTAASQLEAKGYKTVIFEKQAQIGGKCQSYYEEDGTFHPMGAAFFSNATYTETVKVINDAGIMGRNGTASVNATPFALAGDREQFLFDYNSTNGDIEEVPAVTAQFQALLAQEIPRYVALWQSDFEPYSVIGYKNGVPENLTVSGDDWFAANNFTALPVLLVDPLALYGYGDIRIVPILYILQYITPDILTAFVGQHSVYLIDYQRVWIEWAKRNIKSQIFTNTTVSRIIRRGKKITLSYSPTLSLASTQIGPRGPSADDVAEPLDYQDPDQHPYGYIGPNALKHQDCSALVMAFPPTISNLRNAGLDVTSDEEEVFAAVGVHNYYSSAVEFKLPFGVSYIQESNSTVDPPPNNGEPVAALQLYENNTVSTTWSWGPYREFQSILTAYDLLKSTLSKINKDPRNTTEAPTPVTNQDVLEFRKWDYFPHFDSEQLKCGWYDKLNCLQGKLNTFWASGLNGMETVEFAIRAGQDIANSYF